MSNLISIEDVAEMLDVSKFTIYRYIKAGKMEALKVSERKVLIPREELKKFLQGSSTLVSSEEPSE